MNLAILGATALLLSTVLTFVVRKLAVHLRVLDVPNARSSHTVPTPRGGGIAVITTAAVVSAAAAAAGLMDIRHCVTLSLGMFGLGVLGWVDDRRGLRPAVRLLVQGGVAVSTMYLLGGLHRVGLGVVSLEPGVAIGYVLGVLGLLWSINLFNFMDGIDGLAGSQATLIFGVAAALLLMRGEHSLGAMALILSAASLGFLFWNWPPARIFLGDVGSGPIGYAVAMLAIASENRGAVPLVAFALIGGVFVSDATITLVRRMVRGDRVWEAHRDHAYQRLARLWGSHRRVTLAAALVTSMLAGLAFAGILYPRFFWVAAAFGALLLVAALVASERRAPL